MDEYHYIENEHEDGQYYPEKRIDVSKAPYVTEITPQQKEEVIREYIGYIKATNPYEAQLILDMGFFLGEWIDQKPIEEEIEEE